MYKLLFKCAWLKPNESTEDYLRRLKALATDGLYFPAGAAVRSAQVEDFYMKALDPELDFKVSFLENFPSVKIEPGQAVGMCFDEIITEGLHGKLYIPLQSTFVETILRRSYEARKESDVTVYLFGLQGEVNVTIPKHHIHFDGVELGTV